jgi:hypothetical protein
LNSNVQSESDLRNFARNLELLKMNDITSVFYEMLPLCGFGNAIAFSRFLTLHNKIWCGSYELINAYKKEHKGLWGEDIENCLWVRTMHLENAIMAYNTIKDYIYAVLYFHFDLYKLIGKTNIKEKEDILKISKRIQKNTFDKIDEWLSNEVSTKEFFAAFENYKNLTRNLREMANDIKHRGCIIIDGMDLPRITKVTKNIDGINIDITDVVTPRTISIDDEILKLVEVHKQTLDIQKKLYYLCDFQGKLKNFFDNAINKGKSI